MVPCGTREPTRSRPTPQAPDHRLKNRLLHRTPWLLAHLAAPSLRHRYPNQAHLCSAHADRGDHSRPRWPPLRIRAARLGAPRTPRIGSSETDLRLCHAFALALALADERRCGSDLAPALCKRDRRLRHDIHRPCCRCRPERRCKGSHSFSLRRGEGAAPISVHALFLPGAAPNANADGRTPRDYSAAEGHADSAEALPAANSVSSTTSGTRNGEATGSQRSTFRTFELKDTHGFNQFTLIFNRTKIAIDGIRMRLSLTRRKCNAHVIDRFNSEMAGLIKKFTRQYSAGFETTEYGMMDLRIRIDGKNFVWSDSVRTGQLFSSSTRRNSPHEIRGEAHLFPG